MKYGAHHFMALALANALFFFLGTNPLFAKTLPDVDKDGIENVKKWAAQNTNDGEKSFALSGLPRNKSPQNWLGEVVYQIQVDRFANGDTNNDKLNLERNQIEFGNTDKFGIADYRHGGDLQGIIHRLEYLKHLGITTLWITPVFKSTGAYHGYCTSDFTQIEPAFGSNELFRKLVADAHRIGLKVVLDIVVNHMCDNGTKYDDGKTPFREEFYQMCVNDHEIKDWTGRPELRGMRDLNFGTEFFGPFKNHNFFARCGGQAGHSGGAAAIWGDFANGMFDFDTNNWDFQDIFTELHKFWIAYADVDGFRMDAAKHVTADFIAKFSTDIRAYARSIGKDNFFVIGEVAGSADEQALRLGQMTGNRPHALNERLKTLGHAYNHNLQPFPGLTAVYDFSHSGQGAEVLAGHMGPMSIKNWFWLGGELENSNGNPEFLKLVKSGDTRSNWNMIEIHDWPRFLVRAGQNAKIFSALGYLLMTPGTPILYYGVEQGFSGACPDESKNSLRGRALDNVKDICRRTDFSGEAHPKYRQDMFVTGPWRLGSAVPSVQNLSGIGEGWNNNPGFEDWRKDPYLQTNHDLFRYTKKLIAIRKSCRVLQEGNIYFRAVHQTSGNNGGGFFAFSRITPGQGDEVLVLVNTSNNDLPVSQLLISGEIQRGFLGRKFVNLLNTQEAGRISEDSGSVVLKFNDGQFPLTLRANSVAVFAREDHVRPGPDDIGLGVCSH
jgi:glycosidase